MIYETDNDFTLSSLAINTCSCFVFNLPSASLYWHRSSWIAHKLNIDSNFRYQYVTQPFLTTARHRDLLAAANHQNGFKGFRKQFSGRFKRLVSKKSESTSPIPPELRPQLKTIYVY
ncbi:hypothetical protein GQX74_015112 [Glossina fuscipes]|nr:hypothetical protein GQX74_015112 [Glossina fuscipes]